MGLSQGPEGGHLAYCYSILKAIKNATSTAVFWPEVETNEALQARTARFTTKCNLKGEVISKEQQQQCSPPSPSRRDRTNKSFGTSCSPLHVGGIASFSDDTTDTLPPSPSPVASSPSSFFSLGSACSFRCSENITVRPSSFSRWGQSESGTKEATTPVSRPPSASTPRPPSPSRQDPPPRMGRRQKKHARAKVSVSPGVAFVHYRSPTSRANPRGSSLRGSGAIAVRKSRF